jgi:Dolichyl-phosphate-mannose-protein mannosyltransferase
MPPRSAPVEARGGAGGPSPRDRLPWRFVGVLGVYCLLHVLIRLAVRDAVEHDEAEQLLLTQTLALGYGPHPPLYTWLQAALFAVLGVGVPALTLLKHAVIFAVYLGYYVVARRLLGDDRLAWIAAGSLWLMPQMAWEAHRDLNHTVLATALTIATFGLFFRLTEDRRARLYLGLGALVALGLLSKYNFALFVGMLALAALSLDEFWVVVVDRRLLLALGIAALGVLPHAVWVAGQWGSVLQALGERLAIEEGEPAAGRAASLLGLTWAVVRVMGPATLVFVALFPALVRSGRPAEPRPRHQAFLGRLLVGILATLAVATVTLGLPAVKGRWLLPLLVFTPLAFLLRVRCAAPSPGRLAALAALLVGVGLLCLAVRAGEVLIGPRVGVASRLHIPARALADQIRAAGFEGGLVVAGDTVLGGNLRLAFPTSRVVTPFTGPLPDGPAGPCLVVWRPRSPRADVAPPEWLAAFVTAQLGARLPAAPAAVAAAPLKGAPATRYRVAFVILPACGGHAGAGPR